jgi:hypothetical protein
MHSRATVAQALAFRSEGLGARRIAKRMNLPVETVRDWIAGRVPKHSLNDTGESRVPPACDRCGADAHDFAALGASYVYLLGLYLGDGHISAIHRGVYRLRMSLDTRYPGIIASTAETMANIRGGKVHIQPQQGNWVVVSGYWKCWPCLFPQHGPGKKHERPIVLTDWQLELVNYWPEQLLRGLIQSDGFRFQNTGRNNWVWPRYGFHQASDHIRRLFCYACDRMEIHWTQAGERTIYVSRKADVAVLDYFVGPKQ